MSNKDLFLKSDLKNTTKVLWVHSESIHVIEAKLRVCKEYEQFIGSNNILLHHTLDEYDEICKASGAQKLESLNKIVISIIKNIPDRTSLVRIVTMAADQALSWQNIKDLCFGVDLWDDGTHIGIVRNRQYICYFARTVNRLKNKLVAETLNEIAKSLGSKICQGILEHIESRVRANLENELLYRNIKVFPGALFTTYAIVGIFITALNPLLGLMFAVFTIVTAFVWSVDINSTDWREKVADEIYETVLQKKQTIISKSVSRIEAVCTETSTNLLKVSTQIKDRIKRLILVDQNLCKLINQYFLYKFR